MKNYFLNEDLSRCPQKLIDAIEDVSDNQSRRITNIIQHYHFKINETNKSESESYRKNICLLIYNDAKETVNNSKILSQNLKDVTLWYLSTKRKKMIRSNKKK